MSDLVNTFRSYALDNDNCPRMDTEVVYVRVGLLKEAAARIKQLEAALRPFACECVGFCKDAKHNYGEVDPVDTCGYGRARAALEERT